MKGNIFNIQKFSIHDGPGIRTTVFLKGCPLRCAWCSNPESQEQNIQILYDQNKCAHCLKCVNSCLQHALVLVDNKIVVNKNKCIGCLQCVHSCFTHALTHEGKYQAVQDIVHICLQDIDFYEESNGGVTISGGEGLNQPEFVKELVLELKKNHIHVAIETTGYIDSPLFQELAPLFDLLLFDVKHYDSTKHYQGTQVHNELIINNLKWAIEHRIEVLPRIPVIPQFNDSLEDAFHLAQLLLSINAKRVQLLPFHQFGEKKYELLNRDYQLKELKALHKEDLKEYQEIFLKQGLDCFF